MHYQILLLTFVISISTQAQKIDTTWSVLPIRSFEEFEAGAKGGEGEQHPHSIARCYNHPEYIYLSQDVGGSWRSTDDGETWEKNMDKGLYVQFGQSIQVDPVNPEIVFLIVDSSYNYKATGYEGLYRSENGGKSWSHVLYTHAEHARTFRHNIAFDFSKRNSDKPVKTWYAAFNNNGLYRSDDGGITWSDTAVSSLNEHDLVYEVKTHPADSQWVFVASSEGLFVSKNKGENLQKIQSLPKNVSSLEINARHPDSIYATVYDDGLYLSVNGGESFEKTLTHASVRIQLNANHPEIIYLTGLRKTSKVSHNGGADWINLPEASTFKGLGRENGWRRWIDGKLSGIVPNPSDKNEAVAYSRSTIYKTNDAGQSFFESATGWTGNAWSWTDNSAAFDRLNPERFAFFCNDVGTRITTTGADWFHEGTNNQAGQWYPDKIAWYGTYAGDFQPKEDSEVMVAAIGGYFKTQLMRTENLGKTWTLITEGKAEERMNLFISFHSENPNVVYAGNKYSTDGGKTFSQFPFPAKYNSPYVIGMCEAYPDVIFALDKNCSVILRSCDQGQHWTEYAKPGWQFKFFDNLPTFAADPINPNKVYTLDKNHDLACFDGEKWTFLNVMDNVNEKIAYNYVRNVAVDPNNPEVIYAGMFASGISNIFRSMDGGETWQDITYNLARIGGTLKVNPHTGELFRGSLYGTWILPPPYKEIPDPEIPEFDMGIYLPDDTIQLKQGDVMMLIPEVTNACLSDRTLRWQSEDTNIIQVNNTGKIDALAAGSCMVKVSTEIGNYSDSVLVVVESDPTTSMMNIKSELRVHAISENKLMIKLPKPVQSKGLFFLDLSGKKIRDTGFTNRTLHPNEVIDVSGLFTGYYLMVLHTDDDIIVRKFIKTVGYQ